MLCNGSRSEIVLTEAAESFIAPVLLPVPTPSLLWCVSGHREDASSQITAAYTTCFARRVMWAFKHESVPEPCHKFCPHLRCEILWSPTEGFHGGIGSNTFFTKTEVCDFHVSIFVQHQIFKLGKEKQIHFSSHNHPGKWLKSFSDQNSVFFTSNVRLEVWEAIS